MVRNELGVQRILMLLTRLTRCGARRAGARERAAGSLRSTGTTIVEST
jgi:hypothetical protein